MSANCPVNRGSALRYYGVRPSELGATANALWKSRAERMNQELKDRIVSQILPRVQMPAQYLGGELNMVRKDHAAVRGKLCLAFPDTYALGMSHHGLQVLYSLMNVQGRLALRAGVHALGRHGTRIARTPACRCIAWKRSHPFAISTLSASRCSTRSARSTCSRCWTWAASPCTPIGERRSTR